MKKIVLSILSMVLILSLAACGKDDKNRSDYESLDHCLQATTTIEVPTPTKAATPTPTAYFADDQIMNSFHREENIIEVEVDVVCGVAYSEPYSGKALGYLVGENFVTEDFYWADHSNMVGFKMSCVKGFYEADEKGIIHPVEVDDSDGIIWVSDHSAVFNLVPHPENYDGVDWGQ